MPPNSKLRPDIPQDILDDIIELYSNEPFPLPREQRLHIETGVMHYLHDAASLAQSIQETYDLASFFSASILRRAREIHIPAKGIAERIHRPYKLFVDIFRDNGEKNAGDPRRSSREVRLDWGTKMEDGLFLESERVTLAFLMSMACYTRLAAMLSNEGREEHFRS